MLYELFSTIEFCSNELVGKLVNLDFEGPYTFVSLELIFKFGMEPFTLMFVGLISQLFEFLILEERLLNLDSCSSEKFGGFVVISYSLFMLLTIELNFIRVPLSLLITD